MNNLLCRIPLELRDGDGVRVDAMLAAVGATVVRELPRSTHGPGAWVDLLVEHTSAPEDIRGQVVVPVYDELPDPDGGDEAVLVFDRWEPWTPTSSDE